ncbi:acyl-CoA dehydrogenase family protein [Aeromicrobium sp. YIM 150415]|uniref:acyl-CoA dehydrogenase family protein n=1 Tax=Aeromicrobium sp. YIM 150415 TaxID=2803912 RepID=UPI001966291F|nr:acyl-CoA dehydrogenase family protein [Aeromicrobium sp. YIM 150415]MBM9464087.1 acyl-CoA dehydrogenase family protein [Aeromicrobium sp. YIM 150415]
MTATTPEFEFSEEIAELRSIVRQFCAAYSPESVVRETMEGDGFDPSLWQRLGSELGVLGLAVPEEYGGGGAGLVAQAVVVEELGAALLCGPVFGTVGLAMPALVALEDDAVKQRLLPDLCAGTRTATVVAPLFTGAFEESAVTLEAAREGDRWLITGNVAQCIDGGAADLLLVIARTPDGLALLGVDGTAEGVNRTSLTTLDLTRDQTALSFDRARAQLLASGDAARAALERSIHVASVLLSVEQVGGSQRMLDATVAHVSSRKQFGQAIGAFQAVKHRCANMLIYVETARSAAYHGVWAQGDDSIDDAQLAASLALAVANESYLAVCAGAIQLHGGLGFTWEASPHLYFKRATADGLTLGTTTQQLDRLATLVLDAQ